MANTARYSSPYAMQCLPFTGITPVYITASHMFLMPYNFGTQLIDAEQEASFTVGLILADSIYKSIANK